MPKKERCTRIKEATAATTQLRKDILAMLARAGSGHPGGSLSLIDLLYHLYEHIRQDPKKPRLKDRDRVILSAGHLAPALYAVLAHKGYFSKKKLATLRTYGSKLQGHPERGALPGIEATSGPLGQGYAFAVGTALAAKHQGANWKTYCLASDGEHDEGVVWEAAQIAVHHQLSNLCVIIDRNGVQIDGTTKDVMDLKDLKKKYQSFGWKAIEIDGHDHHLIRAALDYATHHARDKPLCIIAHTTLGKGVSFMENNPSWHGKTPSEEELAQATSELERRYHYKRMKQALKEREVLP